jgi:hypothetical protein
MACGVFLSMVVMACNALLTVHGSDGV